VLVVTDDTHGGSHVFLADVSDSIEPLVDTGFSTGADEACNDKSLEPHPCQDGDFTFAPDGQRVAFTQRCTWNPQPGCGFITILDLRTGELTELSATLVQGRHKSGPGALAWSPDGAQIAFIRETDQIGQDTIPDSNLWLIGADGQNLHRVELPVARVTAPQWSPDGKTIALVSDLYHAGVEPETQVDEQNIYIVRPDGTDFRQLTSDDNSSWPEWTLSGQIRFRNGHLTDQSPRYSIMDSDGSNLTALVDLEGLFDAVLPRELGWFGGDLGRSFLWQPAESWQPDR
jgi:Tol biopolymer transport system component